MLELHTSTHKASIDKLGAAHPMTMFAQQNAVESLKEAERGEEAKQLLDVSEPCLSVHVCACRAFFTSDCVTCVASVRGMASTM